MLAPDPPQPRRTEISPDEGERVHFGGLGVRFMIEGAQSGGAFALVEHRIEPRALAAPLHTHRNEDDYTYGLEGETGVQVGDAVRVARPGDLIFKPRGVPHAFWNAGETPARALGAVMARYGFEMDMSSVPVLVERHGLVSGEAPA